MSFDVTRTLLAVALDTVTGVTGHTFRPAVVKNGSGWPQLASLFRVPQGGDAWGSNWDVIVALGQDERAAATFLDQMWPELVDELEQVVYVGGPGAVLPLQISGTQMQVLQVSVVAD